MLQKHVQELQRDWEQSLRNYLKLVDPYNHLKHDSGPIDELNELMPFGESIENALLASLRELGVAAPRNASFSLWLGCRGSTTAMHVDDQPFNLLVVLQGAKRLVVVDDALASFHCRRPLLNPRACWTGIDILGRPPPRIAGLKEITLRAGEALLIPEMHWHSVENLEPTIAVGINEMADECMGSRFASLRP